MSFCRLCKKPYDSTKTSKFNIYKEKSPDAETLKEQIKRITGIELEEGPDKAKTICRECFRKIPNLEKAKETLREWNAEPYNDSHAFDY